jgi:uncharacterized protein YbjT (DUF2867 family)
MMQERKMILVTGASGTVGGEVLRQLREHGAAVRGAFYHPAKAAQAKSTGVDAVVMDFGDRASIASGLKGVDKVFLLGATAPNQSELEINVVEEAKRAGVKHIVKLSVLAAAGEKYTFAKLHRAVEKKIEASGVPYTFLRANQFMQNFVTYQAGTIRSEGAFYAPAKESMTSMIDVRDIAAVAEKALTEVGHTGKTYELTGSEALTNQKAAEKLSAAVGKKISYVDVPPPAFKQSAMNAGIPEFYADALINLNQFYISGAAAMVTGDVERVTRRKPRTFDQFAKDYAGAFR